MRCDCTRSLRYDNDVPPMRTAQADEPRASAIGITQVSFDPVWSVLLLMHTVRRGHFTHTRIPEPRSSLLGRQVPLRLS